MEQQENIENKENPIEKEEPKPEQPVPVEPPKEEQPQEPKQEEQKIWMKFILIKKTRINIITKI